MIRNYIVIAFRNLWRNKLITLINILGMTLGFSMFLSFWGSAKNEIGYDRFHKDIDRLYYLNVRLTMQGSEYTSDRTAGIYYTLLPENFPEIEAASRVSQPLEFELGVKGDTSLNEPVMKYFSTKKVLAVDSTFFRLFTFKFVRGNIQNVFTEPDQIVITEEMAGRLFGNEDPMGKTVKMGEGGYLTVAGVLKNPPTRSSLQFDALIGFHFMKQLGYTIDGYGGTMFYNFFRLTKNADIPKLNKAINERVDENYQSDLEQYFFLDKFRRMHLYGETRSILGVYMDLIMAFIILAIACINFINLTTAYSLTRMKEIFVRKTLGAGRRQLIMQVMGETYIILAIAFYLGLFCLEHMIPLMNRSFGHISAMDLSGWGNRLVIVGIFIVTGLLAGLYPAMKIAGFRPLAFLSDRKNGSGENGKRSRKILIVVQFSFSILFVIQTIFIFRQYRYLKEADLGFNRDQVLYIKTNGKAWDKYDAIKSDLLKLNFVENVTSASEIPTFINFGDIDWGERNEEHNKIARILWTDEDFIKTFDIEMKEGHYFLPGKDSLNFHYVVVNQALVDLMGWKEPVGRNFWMWGKDYQILGVTGNFDFFPFNLKAINNNALIYRYEPVREYIFVRMRPGFTPGDVNMIRKIFMEYNPGYEFIHDLVSEFSYPMMEHGDAMQFMFLMFSSLAIFIAVMGLIGLSVYNNNRRTKEVGIRKVMGANSREIFRLLISEFTRLLLLSNLIALPLAYLIIQKILGFFSYSVEIKLSVFILVFICSLVFSLLTVSYHTFRIARSNPVDSLRYE